VPEGVLTTTGNLAELKSQYPMRFPSEDLILSRIRPGDHILVGTGCGEPQYLINAIIRHVEANPLRMSFGEE
jgi:acyl-CoA hydrolase